MAVVLELLVGLLAAFGLVCLGWMAFGAMVLPVGSEGVATRAVITASGGGEGLEQALSALLWLRRSGLWNGEIFLEDDGLNEEGKALAVRLAQRFSLPMI